MKILFKKARVIDPANKIDGILDILIEDEKIVCVKENVQSEADKVINAKGKIIIPGLVDMHVHLREPGREDKETIESGTRAAAKGGVTTILAMPNTEPAIDCLENLKILEKAINKKALVNVFVSGAITKARAGKKIVDIGELKKNKVIAITDDGSSVENKTIMSNVFKKAKKENVLVICHCEDKKLSKNGVINYGFVSTKKGLRGISKESEYKRIERDIELAKKEKANIHIAHISCKESVEIVEKAKKEGVKVTAETAPHYFSLSEEDLIGFDTNFKMNPPLRNKEDVEAIKKALRGGVIDVIASDHAPHTENEKDVEFERAEFGVTGLETELSVAITNLVVKGILSWTELVEKMAYNPAKILKINKGTLSVGRQADIVMISPEKEWIVKKEDMVSKSKNSCFLGKKLKGVIDMTLCSGKIIYKK